MVDGEDLYDDPSHSAANPVYLWECSGECPSGLVVDQRLLQIDESELESGMRFSLGLTVTVEDGRSIRVDQAYFVNPCKSQSTIAVPADQDYKMEVDETGPLEWIEWTLEY